MTIALDIFRGKSVAVLGLARSGLATLAALKAGGAHSFGWDDGEKTRAACAAEGFDVVAPDHWPWAQLSALVPSPGIPTSHKLFAQARSAGAEIIGEIELLQRARPAARYVGITGTNGKSTTTALIAHIVRQANLPVEVGGNLGTPALALKSLGADGVYVIELSSFQLDLTNALSVDVAVLLNITPDHLDRHGSMDNYIAAKRKIFRAGRLKHAIIGIDDEPSRAIATALAKDGIAVKTISVGRANDTGIAVIDGVMHEAGRAIFDLRPAEALPGAHNWQNAGAAYAATRALGIETDTIKSAMLSFPGLAHRIETVATLKGVRYINDSKATNADAAARALACFETIYWIAGGRAKAGGIASLEPWFDRIACAYLIGEAESEFAATLEGRVRYRRAGNLGAALNAARDDAEREGRPNPVVLLSPACASYDQFANFEGRGETFRTLVQAMQLRGADTMREPLRRTVP